MIKFDGQDNAAESYLSERAHHREIQWTGNSSYMRRSALAAVLRYQSMDSFDMKLPSSSASDDSKRKAELARCITRRKTYKRAWPCDRGWQMLFISSPSRPT
jgi:hypothetical protein